MIKLNPFKLHDLFKGHYGCIESLTDLGDRVVITTRQLDIEQEDLINFAEAQTEGVTILDKWTFRMTFSKEENDFAHFKANYAGTA